VSGLDYIADYPGDDRTHVIAFNSSYKALVYGLLDDLAYADVWEGTDAQRAEMVAKILELQYYVAEPYECPAVGGGGGMELIEEIVLSSDAASVEFNDIPQTYEDILIRAYLRYTSTTAKSLRVRINDDSGNNYDSVFYWTTSLQAVDASYWNVGYMTTSSAAAGKLSAADLSIPGYSGSIRKAAHWRMLSYVGGASNNYVGYTGHGAWRDTDAITDIELYPEANDFLSGAVFRLYGIPLATEE
jgi:hypothetical protein